MSWDAVLSATMVLMLLAWMVLTVRTRARGVYGVAWSGVSWSNAGKVAVEFESDGRAQGSGASERGTGARREQRNQLSWTTHTVSVRGRGARLGVRVRASRFFFLSLSLSLALLPRVPLSISRALLPRLVHSTQS